MPSGLRAFRPERAFRLAADLCGCQTNQLLRWMIGRDPRQFQFDFALWTRKIVGDLIRRMFDVELTPQVRVTLRQAPGLP